MKNMNKKGFTLVEVIVSVVLVSVIMVSMLAALVKLRDTYKVIHDNSDVIVYTSSIARVINNDLMKNNGIRYANCNLEGTDCELILGNDSRRRLEILEEGNGVDLGEEYYSEKKIKHEKIISTLRYTDITKKKEDEEGTLLYIRTLTMDRYTKQTADNKDTNTVTTEGYNFYDISVPEPKEYYGDATEEGKYVDTISTVYIRIWDGKSLESTKYDISLYSSGRYDESGLIGKTYRIQLNTDGAYSPGTLELDEVFGVAYFDSEKNHSSSNIIKKIEVPKKKDASDNPLAFLGYYYYKVGDSVGNQIIDSKGKIVTSSRIFKNDIVLSEDGEDVEKVIALWGVCDNGYKVNSKGECVPEEYRVELNKNGGSGGIDYYMAQYKAMVPNIAETGLPSKTGYAFLGYYYGETPYNDANGNGKVIYNMQNGITLLADWQPNIFTVNYNGNTSTAGAVSSHECEYDAECVLANNGYSKTGHIFTGWKRGEESIKSPGTSIKNVVTSGSVTYKAQWSPCGPGTYVNGNVCSDCPIGTYSSESANQTCTPCPEGYTTDNAKSTKKRDCKINCSQNTSVKQADKQCTTCGEGRHIGGHTVIAGDISDTCPLDTYTITYNTNASGSVGSMPGNGTKTYGVDYTISNNTPTRTGYTFNGWNTASDGAGTPYAKGATYSTNESLSLYAQWSPIQYTITYNKNTSDSVGSMPENGTKTYGIDYIISGNTPTRSGYTFKGWNTSTNGSGTPYAKGETYSTNAALTLHAQWEIVNTNPYLSFKCSNTSQGSAPYTFTYTGRCERNGSESNWWFKFLTDGNMTLTSNLNVDFFLAGGGGQGGEISTDYNLDFYEGNIIGGKGGTGGKTQNFYNKTLSTGNTYAFDIGTGGHCTTNDPTCSYCCDTVAAATKTSISILNIEAAAGTRGGGAAVGANGSDGVYAFGSSTYGRYAGGGGGGCKYSTDYDGTCKRSTSAGNGGAGGGARGCHGGDGSVDADVHAGANTAGGGGGGTAWCYGSGGSGIIIMRKKQ